MVQLSTRKAAQVLGVSEASIKRWCDQGQLRAHKTVGGHRRIHGNAIVEFIRRQKHPLARPDLLGLPRETGTRGFNLNNATVSVSTALITGNETRFRALLMELFLSGHSLHQVFDRLLAPAFHEIGCKWEEGSLDVFHERRGCEICLDVLHELRPLIPLSDNPERTALGGTLQDDWYLLPTTMSELVLREQGWQTIPLGNHLPADSMSLAIQQHKPKIFWLSVSHIEREDHFLRDHEALVYTCRREGTLLLVGGQAISTELRQKMEYTAYCDSFTAMVCLLNSIFADADGEHHA